MATAFPAAGGAAEFELAHNNQEASQDIEATPSPLIDSWYGDSQHFGHHGNPQQWVNVVGNVSGLEATASISYTLNG